MTERLVKFSDGMSSRPFHWRAFSRSMMSAISGSISARDLLHASGHETPEARDLYASALDVAWERARRGDGTIGGIGATVRVSIRSFGGGVGWRRGRGGAEVEARARRRGGGGAGAAGRRPSAREIAGPF